MPKLKSKGLGLPKCICKGFFRDPNCLIPGHGRPVSTKIFWKPEKKQPTISIDSLPSELDIVVLRIGGYWYVNIIDNIIKTTITSNKDGVNTFKESFQDAVDKIPK